MDTASTCSPPDRAADTTVRRYLIWGGKGWIAGHLVELLQAQDEKVFTTTVRMEDQQAVLSELISIDPTHVINAAGCTGRPNIDWCEENKHETLRSNAIGTLNLADCCVKAGVHCTVLATGCIFSYDDDHPIGGPGFTETDEPNFDGSFYSQIKGLVEPMLRCYNCLVLRLRMPVSDDLHPRSFLTKILGYERVVDVPNSHSILHDLLPAAIAMSQHSETGVYNFVNPGVISHNEVLDLFRDAVRPSLTYKNFSLEEQAKVLKAGRSNCKLDTTKLENKLREYDMEVPEIHEAYKRCFTRMKEAGIC
ncbi:NRS/ER protein [Ophiocordyceps camponoti-floridani]|uniref:NRS/ER protein n=1 Tax=Ophiocordyceps camponoti-floridani TaxID=2030778 RepID=A0A8H4VFL1_9HYPO|nr:NRS/ER protein [Ophiocordyceps camponoti-floridani]